MKPILERTTLGEILELTTNPFEPVNQEEVKRNYKKLIMQYQPDRNKSPEAEEYTKRLNKAYVIATGKEKLPQQPQPQQPRVVIRWTYTTSYDGTYYEWIELELVISPLFYFPT